MRSLSGWLLAGFAAVVIYVFGLLSLGYWLPNLAVLAVVAAGLRLAPGPAVVVTIWCGLLLDALSAAGFGLYLAGLLGGWLWVQLLKRFGLSFDNALSLLAALSGGLLWLNLVLTLPVVLFGGGWPPLPVWLVLGSQILSSWLFAMLLPRPLQLKA